jgi:acyl carrier protein
MFALIILAALYGCDSPGSNQTAAPASTGVEATMTDRVEMLISSQMGIPVHDVEPESRLQEDLGFDELDRVELVMEMEEAFDIRIDDETAASLRTVGDAIRAVTKQTRKGRLTNDGIPIRPPATG